MQITLNLPDNLDPTETLNQKDWLREIAIALFQKELGVHPTFVILSGTECSEGSQSSRHIGILHFAIATFRMTLAKVGCTQELVTLGTASQIAGMHQLGHNLTH